MTKNGVESENEFDVDDPEEVTKEVKPKANSLSASRRQSTRVRVSRVPVVVDTGSTDEDLSDDSDDFERLQPARKRGSAGKRTGGGGGGRSRGRPAKSARVSSSSATASNGQADPDPETAGSDDNSNASDNEPTSTTLTHSTTFQSGSFVVSKKDFKKLTDPPLWKIDGKALLQKYIPFQLDGKTHYKNTSVYSGWSAATKVKYYPCTVVFNKRTKRENVLEFVRDKIVVDENYVCSESEAEGDVEDDDEERNDGAEVANGTGKQIKDKGSDEDNDQDDQQDNEDEEEEGEEDGDYEDNDDNGEKEKDEVKESDDKPKE
ncbi:ESF1 homolog [Nilaparvata lugens]|uniref:ESF1 homolog n=1 Tax=Nilaparvata lugens TaxID=108931 RepID=UPI000B98AD33|nr:ESF1 homolog [Nilaparvata lugens]